MKNSYLLLTFLIIGCTQQTKNESADVVESTNKEESIFLHTPGAVKAFEDGSFMSGDSAIEMFYQTNQLTIDTSWTIKRIMANDRYSYEIGSFVSGEKEFTQLLIWSNQDSVVKRDFEFIAVKESVTKIPDEIDSVRNLWMELSNAHQPENLVKSTYHEKALYYNHRPMIVGVEDIARTYDYMNNPGYQLTLEPILIEPVNESLIFEIGQCSGSYGGKYILVWQRNDQGDWKILLDSNI
ncbi:MAG: hypothetical protein CMB80_17795 [Flammeovirgaceae bacterium]|nr:hypothetical protein [Flammeovirgaceae bacterium]MBR10893.1 hypothetical protein [Rickettsiales bacterium]HCX22499.1 hypothetical protein [Cytophagales bacterium]|tara:strand:+ start:3638 stop:4354 length:717 start_codon:yes stop_codon:yes gene_type:complete